MFNVKLQTESDSDAIEDLMVEAFGPKRHSRSVWNLRRRCPVACLCLVGYENDCLVGSIRFWEVFLGREKILLLGPLAVQASLWGKGFGQQLVFEGIQRASNGRWRLILVSGEPDYYPKFGFVPAADFGLEWSGYVETEGLQLSEFVGGSLAGFQKTSCGSCHCAVGLI